MAIEYKLKFTGQEIDEKLTKVENKQDKLAFDIEPTEGSENPVTSGGIYTAIQNQINLIPTKVSQLENDRGFLISKDIEKIDYESLENKPFYSETVTDIDRDIIPLQRIELTSGDGAPEGCALAQVALTALSPIISNASYNFTFDGETTQTTSIYIDGTFILGNPSLMGMGEDTGEPFLILFMYDDGEIDSPVCGVIYRTTEGTHTIGLSYIGDTIPLIPEDTYNFELQYDSKDDWYYYDVYWDEIFGLRPQDGDKYKLTFGDTVCEITPVYNDDRESYLAGNLHIDDEEAEDTGENYFLKMYEDYIEITPLVEGNYVVSLEKALQVTEKEIVHKIDSKYLDIDIDMDVPYTEDTEGNVVFENDILIDSGDISVGTSITEINEDITNINKDITNIDTSIKEINETVADLQLELAPQPSSVSFDDIIGNASLEITTAYSVQKFTFSFFNSNDAQRIIDEAFGYPFVEIVFSDEINTSYHFRFGSMSIYQYASTQIILENVSFLSDEGNPPTISNGTRRVQRIRFYTDNGRSAHVEGEYTAARGIAAHAEGSNTEAIGQYSHAEGSYTTANGRDSHAEGYETTANGQHSHAEGSSTEAIGDNSHAEGYCTTASGNYSHAEGLITTASGVAAHAEGRNTEAIGQYSHAEGSYTEANGHDSHAEGQNTTTSGVAAHAEGQSTTASGSNSHAEGSSTEAIGDNSHAEGQNTTTSGIAAHAEGTITTASGFAAHAEGCETIASGLHQHVQGRYNIEDAEGKYAHIVGNGIPANGIGNSTSEDIRSNAHTLDWKGNAWYAGKVESTGIILSSTTEGSTKRFLITVNDTGTLTATEIV